VTEKSQKWLEGFVQLPMRAVLAEELSDGELRTLAYVVGRIFVRSFSLSITEIAADRRLSWQVAQRHLRRLRDLNYLTAREGRNGALVWSRGEKIPRDTPPTAKVRSPLSQKLGPPTAKVRSPLSQKLGISRSGIIQENRSGIRPAVEPPPLDELLDVIAAGRDAPASADPPRRVAARRRAR
jgi:hypothetical protein